MMRVAETVSDDRTELTLLRRQDPAAFTRLVERCQGLVMGLCQSLGMHGTDRDDAAAEAFAAVYSALPGFDGRSAPTTWVYCIAWRTIARFRKKRSATAAVESAADRPDHNPGPRATAEAAETRQRVWSAVANLEPRQAAAVEMFYRRDLSVEEIAAILQCPTGTVKTLLFRAREQLRRTLASENATT
jgi:RNA polymerase sigma-70 factor (ECF subfamily)